ncbi:MAG: T9SS type A sorting domain-containing protein [Flavobacteriales bacterium]|nr:T9SS type A sorting domain-containing protein [Flavobacteriales bacterium]
MKRRLLFIILFLSSLSSYSQTTYTIEVTDPSYSDTITVQVGDILDFINMDISAPFYVLDYGNGVPGYTPAGSTITTGSSIYTLTVNLFDTDFDVEISSASTSAGVMLHVIVDHTASVVNDLSDVTFSAYPNPTTDFLNISGGNIESIKIFDVNGRLVLAEGLNSRVDVSTLDEGMYLLVINNYQRIKFKKSK